MYVRSRGDRDALSQGFADQARSPRERLELLRSVAEKVHRKVQIPLEIERGCACRNVFAAKARADENQIDIAEAVRPAASSRAKQNHRLELVSRLDLAPEALKLLY